MKRATDKESSMTLEKATFTLTLTYAEMSALYEAAHQQASTLREKNTEAAQATYSALLASTGKMLNADRS